MSENKKRKRLFDLIFEEVEEKKEPTPTNNSEPQPQAPTFTPQPSAADETRVNELWKVIIDENLPGPDYVELKDNIQALRDSGVPMTEEQLMISAYSVLKRQYPVLTKEIIINSIDKYKKIIETERTNGLKEIEDLKSTRISSKNAEIEALKTKRESIENQIRKEREELGKIELDMRRLEDEVAENTNDINRSQQEFESSINRVLQDLEKDRDKIKSLNVQ